MPSGAGLLRRAALALLLGVAACSQLPVVGPDAAADVVGDTGDAGCGCPPRVTQLSASAGHVCAVDDQHAVWCWGANLRGESAPDLDDSAVTRPRRVQGVAAVAVSAGWGRTCVLRAEGLVQCWGHGEGMGAGAPAMVPGLVDATQIAVGDELACALRTGGAIVCWTDGRTPVAPFPTLPAVRAIGALRDAVCVLRVDGLVSCFGHNEHGQRGAVVPADDLGVNLVEGPAGVTALSTGSAHACALDADAGLWCWGSNANGQLMQGHVHDAPNAARSDFARDVVAVSTGGDTTFALGRNGAWLASGDNEYRQLQLDTVAEQVLPRRTLIGLGADIAALAAGEGFTCALVSHDHSVRCWGSNAYGALGRGTLGGTSTAPASPAW